MFQNELDVDETLAQLLVAEGFGALEEVAYVEARRALLDRGLRRGARRRAAEPRRRGAPAPGGGRPRGAPRAGRRGRSRRNALSHRGDAGHARQGRGSRRSTTSPISPPTSWSRRSGPSRAASASRATGPRTKAACSPNTASTTSRATRSSWPPAPTGSRTRTQPARRRRRGGRDCGNLPNETARPVRHSARAQVHPVAADTPPRDELDPPRARPRRRGRARRARPGAGPRRLDRRRPGRRSRRRRPRAS